MSDPFAIADLYDHFLDEGYEGLARDPESYPLFPVITELGSRYPMLIKGKSVLDLGCGPGLLKELTDFGRYMGVDLSESMLQAAASKGYAELIQASVEEYLPLLPDKSFDVVYCFSVLYFLDPAAVQGAIAHIQRIARRGWLITLDGAPTDLVEAYKREQGVDLYDHRGLEIADAKERFTVPGWKSSIDGQPISMEIVVGGLLA